MTVFMRDIAANLTMLDIIRGAPAIYVTWPGYDEVAHHSGPWTSDAFKVLATYDQIIARIRRTIQEKAPRPYDLIILSDHGQSFGATFKQRYGLSLKEFIEQQLPQGTTVAQSIGGDTGVTSLTAASGELANIQQSRASAASVGARWPSAARSCSIKSARQQEEMAGDPGHDQPAQVTAYGSGNLAQVYFDLYPRKITLSELNAAYPGMVDALVQHEGIGMVCGYDDDGVPVALGKDGTRNLHTGEVTGEDPLQPYAPDGSRCARSCHSGDAGVAGAPGHGFPPCRRPDGHQHGLPGWHSRGAGGTDRQPWRPGRRTNRRLSLPPAGPGRAADAQCRPTCSTSLNGRRGQPVTEDGARDLPEAEPAADAWSLGNLWAGLKDVRTWLPLAGRALVLDRSAYQEAVDDKRMTAPALLLGPGLLVIYVLVRGEPLAAVPAQVAIWFMGVLAIYAAGRLLADNGSYTRTLRGLGFANVVTLIEMIGLIPALAPLAAPLGTLLSFVAIWMGAAAAHNARGWRSIILPILGVFFVVAGTAPRTDDVRRCYS